MYSLIHNVWDPRIVSERKTACIGHTVHGYYSSYSLVTHQRNFKNGENCSLTYIKEKKKKKEGGEREGSLSSKIK